MGRIRVCSPLHTPPPPQNPLMCRCLMGPHKCLGALNREGHRPEQPPGPGCKRLPAAATDGKLTGIKGYARIKGYAATGSGFARVGARPAQGSTATLTHRGMQPSPRGSRHGTRALHPFSWRTRGQCQHPASRGPALPCFFFRSPSAAMAGKRRGAHQAQAPLLPATAISCAGPGEVFARCCQPVFHPTSPSPPLSPRSGHRSNFLLCSRYEKRG